MGGQVALLATASLSGSRGITKRISIKRALAHEAVREGVWRRLFPLTFPEQWWELSVLLEMKKERACQLREYGNKELLCAVSGCLCSMWFSCDLFEKQNI